MKTYLAKIALNDLVHDTYYFGKCRNATIAKWDNERKFFVHWRNKFAWDFLETIKHPEQETRYDVFVVERLAMPEEINKVIDLQMLVQ